MACSCGLELLARYMATHFVPYSSISISRTASRPRPLTLFEPQIAPPQTTTELKAELARLRDERLAKKAEREGGNRV